MYNTTFILLTLGLLVQGFNFLKSLVGPGVSQFGLHIPGWTISMALIPSLAVGILTLMLLNKKNAASFWVYLAATIMATGGAFNAIANIAQLSEVAGANVSPVQLWISSSIALFAVLLVKFWLCWMMWQLIKRGELTYQHKTENVFE